MAEEHPADLLALTADIVSSHVGGNRVAHDDLPALIQAVHGALVGLLLPADEAPPARAQPAVSIRKSIQPDYLVCLEDGKRLKMMKRYLARAYGLTPAQYRAKWNLPSAYPMIAPDYADRRREIAKGIGLGGNRGKATLATAKAAGLRKRKPRSK